MSRARPRHNRAATLSYLMLPVDDLDCLTSDVLINFFPAGVQRHQHHQDHRIVIKAYGMHIVCPVVEIPIVKSGLSLGRHPISRFAILITFGIPMPESYNAVRNIMPQLAPNSFLLFLVDSQGYG